MNGLEETSIQWHPGFYGAAEIELVSNKGDLEFQREYNLSKEPLRMDLLIIKKLSNVKIENEIGHIFKKYNVIEYKSPDDGLTIDDYYKTVGYACLYKGLGEVVNQIPTKELTVSIFRESYPRELFESLKREGLKIEKKYSGIYYISGQILFDTQIVVTKQLDKETHQSLRILSRKAQGDDVRSFIEAAAHLTDPGDRNNVEAVLQVSISANKELYEEVRRSAAMCEALRELMKEEIEEAVEKATKEATEKAAKEAEKAIKENEQNTVLAGIKSLMENTKWTADQAMAALNVPVSDRPKYALRL